MTEAIKNFFLETVGEELCVFFCSMIPIIELRGGIPLGAGLGLPWWTTVMLAIVGNLLPVPIILLCVRAVIAWMAHCRVKMFNKIADWLYAKVEKNRGKIERYAFWGLAFFVAIPLPGTGAWTGALVASVTGMRFWRSMLSVTIGVLIAAIVMVVASYGAVAALGWLV